MRQLLRVATGVFTVIGCMVHTSTSFAQDDEPVRLPALSSWVMDYADDSCALQRTFGNPQHEVALQWRSYAPGAGVEVTAATASYRLQSNAPHSAFLPAEQLVERYLIATFKSPEGVEGAMYQQPPDVAELATGNKDAGPIDPVLRDRRESQIEAYALHGLFDRDLTLETGPMHEPMEALRSCLDDLLTRWDLDAPAHRTLRRYAGIENWRTILPRVIRDINPRAVTLKEGESDRIRFWLFVSPHGRATSCRAKSQHDDDRLAQAACDSLAKNVRLDPALDANGQPIASVYSNILLLFE